LNSATGTFSGKPAAAGNFSFEVIVTDSTTSVTAPAEISRSVCLRLARLCFRSRSSSSLPPSAEPPTPG
jgi:hypothetical protein